MPIRKTPHGWTFSIPASLSPTGKRYRPFFPTKGKAEAERQIYMNGAKRYGSSGNILTPSEAEDARRALDAIEGKGLTLTEIVTQWKRRNDTVNQSLTVGEILRRVYRIKAGLDPSPLPGASRNPKPLRDSTLKGMEDAYNKLTDTIGKVNAADLTTTRAKLAASKVYKSNSYFDSSIRYLKAAFNFATKAGWAPDNPFVGIEREHRPTGEIDILETAKEARAVLEACKDYRKADKFPEYCKADCREVLPAIAVALFAGIRPGGELIRLRWEDVEFDHGLIRVPGEASKTHTLRHVEIAPNLQAFLEPYRGKTGPLCCTGWQRKYKAVRYATGLNKRSTDILRHTYASAFLAAGRSMDELLQNIGHTTQKTTLKHYIAAMTPHEARALWLIGPQGWQPLQAVEKRGEGHA
jgi:integrase